MAENKGWLLIHRQIQDHWIWKDANKLKWWIDILLTVNTIGSKVPIGNEIFICNRGESLLSIQSWATRWNVSKDTARNFLTMLEKDKMINRVNIGKSTRLSICNYDSYQRPLHVKQTDTVQTHDTNKEVKELRNKGSKLPLSDKEVFFLKMFNELTGREFKILDDKTRKQLIKISGLNYTVSDIKRTISVALSEMKQRDNEGYLTPEFITRPTEFQKYVTMKPKQQNNTTVLSSAPAPINHQQYEEQH